MSTKRGEPHSAYLAPERLLGQSSDARADLFSMGVVFHEMLTGQRLFAGETHEATLNNVLAKQPVPPSHFGPSCPVELDAVCLRALSRDPKLRFQSAGEMLAFVHRAALSAGCLSSSLDVAQFFESHFSVELALLRARLPTHSQGKERGRPSSAALSKLHGAATSRQSPNGSEPHDAATSDGTERILRNDFMMSRKQRALWLVGAAFVAAAGALAFVRPAALSFLFEFEGLDRPALFEPPPPPAGEPASAAERSSLLESTTLSTKELP